MAEFNQPTTKQEFDRNFAQIKPDMSKTEALFESSRCLNCYDAPCVHACPTRIDIPLFIKQINTQNITGAARTIFNSNYLANTCGKVCPTEVLCEGACVYNLQDVKPIEIGRLQSFASVHAISLDKKLFTPAPPNGKKIAIIGAGPAGISCACELALLGFQVDIFEANSQPTGLVVHGIAPYKLTNLEPLTELAFLQKQLPFSLLLNHPISSKEDVQMLEKSYDAVFLGIGLGPTSSLSIPGENLPGCEGAVEFIKRLRAGHHEIKVPKRVIVLGGGNTAMDAASESARMGASVTLAYRRSKDSMGAYDFEYDLAKEVGVQTIFNASPVAIEGSGHAEGVRFIETRDVNGKLEEIPGSEFTLPCDAVIMATGQSKHKELLATIGLDTDKKGRIILDANQQCSKPGFFAAGDAVSGGQEVVNAVADGKKAAQAISAYIFS